MSKRKGDFFLGFLPLCTNNGNHLKPTSLVTARQKSKCVCHPDKLFSISMQFCLLPIVRSDGRDFVVLWRQMNVLCLIQRPLATSYSPPQLTSVYRRGKTTWKDSPGAKRSGQPAQFCTLLSIGFHDVSTISETEKLANGASIITLIFGGSVLIVGVFTIILGVSTPFSLPAWCWIDMTFFVWFSRCCLKSL